MREILFKAQRTDGGGWVEGCVVSYGCDAVIRTIEKKWYPVIPKTVCQFTGQRDCDNERIFEGDEVEDEYAGMYIIEMRDSTWTAVWGGKDPDLYSMRIDELEFSLTGRNIHDEVTE